MPKAQHCRHFLTMLKRTTKGGYGKRLCSIIAPCYCLCKKKIEKKIYWFLKKNIGKIVINIVVTFWPCWKGLQNFKWEVIKSVYALLLSPCLLLCKKKNWKKKYNFKKKILKNAKIPTLSSLFTFLERTTKFWMGEFGKRLCFIIAPCYCLCDNKQ